MPKHSATHSYRLSVKTPGVAAAECVEFAGYSVANAVCMIERMTGEVEVEISEDGRRLGVMRRIPGASPSWLVLP